MLDSQSVIQVDPSALLRQWDEKGVLFHPPSGQTLLLSPLLVEAIQQLVSTPKTFEQLTQEIVNEYQLTSDSIRTGLFDGLTRLINDGILKIE